MQMRIKEFGLKTLARHAMGNKQDAELLRSELYSLKQLTLHAVKLAGLHVLDPHPGPDMLLPRLADNARALRAAYDIVTVTATPGGRIVPAEAWLLDNFYLIEQQISLARRHLPRGYSRQLPRLAEGPSAGFPRIYDLALELISHMDGRVDNDNATQFVAAYQTAEPLMLGELWAFPIMLQLALLENIRRIGIRIARRREERDAAITWAQRMQATAEKEPKKLILLLAEFANADVPLTAAFVEEFHARLLTQGASMAFIQTWIGQKLLEQGVTATQLSEAAGRTAATNQLSIANSIGSLRFIGAMDWKKYVESLSLVEQTLREDPAGMHARQDFATRDRYRHVVEEVARGSSQSELAVTRQVLSLARAAAQRLGADDRAAHVGYYLLDRGRPLLERTIASRPSLAAWAGRANRTVRLVLYLGPILLLTILMAWVALAAFGGFAPEDWRYWLVSITALLSGSALAVPLVNLAATWLLPPRTLPRLDFSQGIPAEHRTMVVVPTLLGSPQDIDSLAEALEIRYLGNRDNNLFFALLTDFPDAPERMLPTDAASLAHARAALEALNTTYRDDRPCIFFLFHRPREWNPPNGPGWATSASAANWSSLTPSCAGKPYPLSRRPWAMRPSSLRSATSSPWTPTRNCPGTRPGRWSATWPIRSIARSTTPPRGASSVATPSCNPAFPSVWPAPGSRASRNSSRAKPASIPIPAKCPTPTRTFSARGRLSARASTTWTPSARPWTGAFRKTSS